jgi:hypothetical protein
MYPPPTIKDVLQAIKLLIHIPRPVGDNEGDCINWNTIMRYLSLQHQNAVQHAVEILHNYTRHTDGQPVRKSINTLSRNGFPAFLHEDQYNPNRIVGRVSVGEWDIDISDPADETEEY